MTKCLDLLTAHPSVIFSTHVLLSRVKHWHFSYSFVVSKPSFPITEVSNSHSIMLDLNVPKSYEFYTCFSKFPPIAVDQAVAPIILSLFLIMRYNLRDISKPSMAKAFSYIIFSVSSYTYFFVPMLLHYSLFQVMHACSKKLSCLSSQASSYTRGLVRSCPLLCLHTIIGIKLGEPLLGKSALV